MAVKRKRNIIHSDFHAKQDLLHERIRKENQIKMSTQIERVKRVQQNKGLDPLCDNEDGSLGCCIIDRKKHK